MLNVDMIIFHVNTIMLHVNMIMSNVAMIILHVDMIILHVKHCYVACRSLEMNILLGNILCFILT